MNSNLTIVVAIYNGSNHIAAFFRRISNYHHGFQWIFVNDSSIDETYFTLKKLIENKANMRLLSLPKNKGPFQARLLGVQNCQTSFWTYVDIDDYIDLKSLYKYGRETYFEYAPIFKLDYVDKKFNRLGNFKIKNRHKNENYKLKNYPNWNFPACGIYEKELYLTEFGNMTSAPYNFDEYSFRHYHTIINKPIQEIDVTYSYVVEGNSLSRSFSEKRLSYYKSITLLRRQMCRRRYKVKYHDLLIDTTRLATNDIKQILKSKMSSRMKIKFISRIFGEFFSTIILT